MSEDVACTSTRTIDGWTGEPMGWFYGFHIVKRMPADRKCSRCGLDLSPNTDETSSDNTK